jgi:hypothetical protein
MRIKSTQYVLLTFVLFFCFSQLAFTANILFVMDGDNDQNIGPVLQGAGHTVTTVLNDFDTTEEDNAVLQGPGLDVYDVIFWAASGSNNGDEHNAATFTNLSTYVSGGGRIFITGYDSIASPRDPNLIAFIGASDSDDSSSENVNGPVTGVNNLSSGVVNIVGVVPTGGHSDSDTAEGLTSATCVVSRPNEGAGDCAWTLRKLGAGEIAYVSNGEDAVAHPSWNDAAAGGNGAYNAALRNYAANAAGVGGTGAPPPPAVPVPTMSTWLMLLMALSLGLLAARRLPRRGGG